jgi:hypothetical protein
MRPSIFVGTVVSLVLCVRSLEGQAPPPVPPESATGSTLVLEAQRVTRAPPATLVKVRARLISSDGRVLISGGTGTMALAWLVDTSKASRDSTHFTVTFTPGEATHSAVITDWKGRCLSLTGRESSIPLDFGACNRQPLIVYPAPNAQIAAGKAGFWLLTKVGQVGPTTGSPLLLPRSPLKVWFRLEPMT